MPTRNPLHPNARRDLADRLRRAAETIGTADPHDPQTRLALYRAANDLYLASQDARRLADALDAAAPEPEPEPAPLAGDLDAVHAAQEEAAEEPAEPAEERYPGDDYTGEDDLTWNAIACQYAGTDDPDA